LAFYAFYRENPHAFPMSLEQTVAYIWMQQAFVALFFIWFYDNSIFASIENGDIAYEMVRPMDLYGRWFAMTGANRMSRAVLRCFPILMVAVLIPGVLRMRMDISIAYFFIVLMSMLLSMLVVVSFSMLIYISAFYTINSMGVRIIVGVAADFLAGGYLPIPFFPDTLRRFVELSPFGSMQNMPLLIFSGVVRGEAMLQGLLLQVFWFVVLVVVGRLWLSYALKRVIAQGG